MRQPRYSLCAPHPLTTFPHGFILTVWVWCGAGTQVSCEWQSWILYLLQTLGKGTCQFSSKQTCLPSPSWGFISGRERGVACTNEQRNHRKRCFSKFLMSCLNRFQLFRCDHRNVKENSHSSVLLRPMVWLWMPVSITDIYQTVPGHGY